MVKDAREVWERGMRSTMPRDREILKGLQVGQLRGVEVGPLDKPLVRKEQGPVFYVDHCSTEELKQRWAPDKNVDCSRLHVDAVWGQRTLCESLNEAGHGSAGEFDYVVASHVVEHVPDLVSWLGEVRTVLGSKGSLRLAVPDKRYTFDMNRRETVLGDVLESYVRKCRVPNAGRILDFALNMGSVDVVEAWAGKVMPQAVKRGYTDADALALARDAEVNGAYHDVHCWVFTPLSFMSLMAAMSRMGLMPFACEWISTTRQNTFEFFVAMRPEDDRQLVERSWTVALS